MKKIIASTIAAGLIAGSTMTAAADQSLERAAAPASEAEQMGEDGDAGTILVVLLGAAVAAGAVILIESGEDEDVPTSP